MVGIDRLGEMADAVFGEDDPAKVFFKDSPIEIKTTDGEYVLSIKLPGVKKNDIDLWVKDGELIISVIDYQRNIMLPQALRDLELAKASYADGRFNVTFREAT